MCQAGLEEASSSSATVGKGEGRINMTMLTSNAKRQEGCRWITMEVASAGGAAGGLEDSAKAHSETLWQL